MPRAPSPRRPVARKAHGTDLHGEAIEQAESLNRGEDWLRLLRYAEHFHEYGGANALLILRNRPHATRLATYEQWKRDGHPVRRRERGITVFDPTKLRETVRLFDITQTGQPPVAGPLRTLRPARHAPDAVLTALTSIAERRGFDVRFDTPDTSARTASGERSIRLHPALTPDAACYALAHELAHLLLHPDLDRETRMCHGTRLVEAESVAYLVCRHAGLDVTPFSFPRPSTWAGDDPRANRGRTILHTVNRIGSIAHTLITQVDAINRGRTPGAQRDPDRTRQLVQRPTAHLVDIHKRAERFFIDQLPGSWVPGYLAERGLADALDDGAPWGIGYAPATWTALTDHLRAHGYTDDQIIESGLGTRSRTGHLIDRFRDRAIIPVHTPDGTSIAFIGRANPDATASNRHPAPKYLNSPQTPLYAKGTTLFGLDIARARLNAGAIPVLVEGTIDAIAIHIADIGNQYAPVAPSGTALTTEQVTALSQVVDLSERGVLVAFDGDAAGQHAAARAHRLLDAHTDRLLHAHLGVGDDPAGLLQDGGPRHLLNALANRTPLAAVVLDEHLSTTRDRRNWERRDDAARLIVKLTPADAVRQLAHAGIPGPDSAPENAAPTSVTTAARHLSSATSHLIFRAANHIAIPAGEMTIAVVDAASEQEFGGGGPAANGDRIPGPAPTGARDSTGSPPTANPEISDPATARASRNSTARTP